MNSKFFIESIFHYIEKYHLLPSGSAIIVGFSGGPDSLFLLHLLHHLASQKNISLITAHLDHQWRSNSADDAHFCKQIANRLNVPFVSARACDLPSSIRTHGSQEEIGRHMRRYFLQHVRQEHNANLIALGHHAQDQQETFFIRLIRGTTLSGLVSMRPKDGVYIRPLLTTNKTDIVNYLQENNITYLIDPSNQSPSFLRNRIRAQVLPALQECDQRFDQNFARTIDSLQHTEQFLTDLTKKTFHTIAHKNKETWYLDIQKLQEHPLYMRYRLLMYWLITEQVPFSPSENFLQEISRFLFQSTQKMHQLHAHWHITRTAQYAYIVHMRRS